MMKKTLIPARGTRLHNEEKVQLVVRMISEIESSKIRIVDEDLKKLIARVKTKLTAYNALQAPVRQSQHTGKLKEADEMRDADIKALFAGIRLYRSSKRENEQAAYKSLYALIKLYKDVTKRNYEEETAVIGKLLNTLQSEQYSSDIATLHLTPLVTRLNESQTQFETLFTAKVKSELARPKVNFKKERDELFEEYQCFCQYIESMVWAKGTDVYVKLLDIINNGRKYFAEAVHKRDGAAKKRVKKVKNTVESKEEVDEESVILTEEAITPNTSEHEEASSPSEP